jgi:hypothetical protein
MASEWGREYSVEISFKFFGGVLNNGVDGNG